MHGELTKNRLFLRQVAHAFTRVAIHGHGGYVAILENHTAGVWTDEADNHVERGGLRRAWDRADRRFRRA